MLLDGSMKLDSGGVRLAREPKVEPDTFTMKGLFSTLLRSKILKFKYDTRQNATGHVLNGNCEI